MITSARGAGKTTAIIKQCAKDGGVIVCFNHIEAQRVKKVAEKMGVKIKDPISFEAFLERRYVGKQGARKIHIDNVDLCLHQLSLYEIATVSITDDTGGVE